MLLLPPIWAVRRLGRSFLQTATTLRRSAVSTFSWTVSESEIDVSYRKASRATEGLLSFNSTSAAMIGFEKSLAQQAQPIVADIEKKIASAGGPVNADETYWTLDGDRAYY